MFWLIVIAIIIVGVAMGISQANAQAEELKGKRAAIAGLTDFVPTVTYHGGHGEAGIAFDPVHSKFALVPPKGTPRLFKFDQVVAAEIERDGMSLQRTNRGSQALGAALGGVLLGPLGALAGGVTGSKRTRDKIRKLSLKIYTNDLVKPVHEIVFLSQPKGVYPDSGLARPALDSLEQWYGRFRNLLATRTDEKQPAAEHKWYKVTLNHDGGRTIDVIKLLRELTGAGLADAVDTVKATPSVLMNAGTLDEAAAWVAQFEAVGASASMEEIQ